MTWEEVLATNAEQVVVKSYGYSEKGIFGHYEPFSKQRRLLFRINRDLEMLDHPVFYLSDKESDLYFYVEDGKICVNDPEIVAKNY